MKKNNTIFSQRLKQLRTDNGLTQSQLGEKISVIKQAISSYENGSGFPAFNTLCDIANALSTNLDYLVGRDDFAERPCPSWLKPLLDDINKLKPAAKKKLISMIEGFLASQ